MAKKKAAAAVTASNTRLETFAEDLGRVLGTAEHKARGWLDQRKDIVKQLSQLRDRTDTLLRELTDGGANMAIAVGLARGTNRGRPSGSAKTGGKKRGRRTFTAEQRRQQGERMKAYWAKRKAEGKKSGKKRGRKGAATAGAAE